MLLHPDSKQIIQAATPEATSKLILHFTNTQELQLCT